MAPGLLSDTVKGSGEHLAETTINQSSGQKRAASTEPIPRTHPQSLRLQLSSTDEVHDLVCVGFGPASLAIAIALHDSVDVIPRDGKGSRSPSVRFLERQETFGWHAGMLLPGAKMQISFIKDLATLRDPTSRFTFLNYLKQHNRLAEFSNLGTFLPSRLEFADYMKWAASHFDNVVDYGHEVDYIRPQKESKGEKYDCLEIQSRDITTGEITRHRSRNVVIAIGGRPSRPSIFPAKHDRILHSSEFSKRITQVLPHKEKAYNVVVIGSGQSAAEVFNDLHTRYPNSNTRLVFRDTALRPSDDSPFVNEIFHPDAVDNFYRQSPDVRDHKIMKDKATNYSVVRPELLEKLYEKQYMESIKQPDRNLWQHQILPCRDVVEVTDLPQNKRLNLTLKSSISQQSKSKEVLSVDAVILATGYHRNVHVDMLKQCQNINGSANGTWSAGRDYGVKLDDDFVEDNVGIWLQGCNEGTHGLSDSLLSILATRSGELVHSILNHGRDNKR